MSAIKKAIQRLREHRGMNDLLTYLIALDGNTVLHKDGSLSRHFCYVAPDLESSTESDFEYHAETWRHVFQFLDNGWMLETNVLSHLFQSDQSSREFPEIVSALIDDERRLQYHSDHYFHSIYYLSLTYRPEQEMASALRRLATDTGEQNILAFDDVLEHFNRVVMDATRYLRRSLIRIEPLEGDALTTFLHQCITGTTSRLKSPYLGSFLDCYLAQEFVAGFQPKIGDRYIQVLSIDDIPARLYPAILDALSYFPVAYRWSSRFIALNNHTAQRYLKRFERSWSSKAIGMLGVVRESLGMPTRLDEDAEQVATTLREAQQAASSGQVGHGFYNSVLIVMHEDRTVLNKISDAMVSRIQQMDFQVRRETVNATEAYLGSLPSHGDYNLRKMPVDTDFVSCVLPISAVYQGEPKAPCPLPGYQNQPALLLTTTRGQRPFHFNLHVGDVGHTAVLGPTGSGKTTLNALLMASHRRYPDSRVIVLDKDYSNRAVIQALGGNYYDLTHNDCALAPLGRIHSDHPETIDQAVAWLSSCCQVQGISLSPGQYRTLREAVVRLSQEAPQYKNLNHLSLQDAAAREAIAAFNSGGFQTLLNGTHTAFAQKDVMGFEMGALVGHSHRDTVFHIPVIKAILNELEALFHDKRPTLLILEEAWLYLSHPLFFAQLTDWFKTLRKMNVSVIFVSQDLDDIVTSNAAAVIQNSCMTRIYLPNASAGEPHVKDQYRAFGLNETQINMIRTATPKRDYYYQSPNGHRLFQLDLGELAQAFLCISQKEDLEMLEQCYQLNDPRWVLKWLDYRQLNAWRDFAYRHYFKEFE